MVYDLSATVHYKPTTGGKGHYMAINKSQASRSQQWFMYDDDRVSPSNFTNKNNKVTIQYMKTANIMFYVTHEHIKIKHITSMEKLKKRMNIQHQK